MGPRRFQRGYSSKSGRSSGSPPKLQWGHAVSSVDTTQAEVNAILAKELQWGHAVSSVDTDSGVQTFTVSSELQWGHAVSSVDMERR